MIRVGEKLKEERTKRGLTVIEVAKATKIRPAFLQAIESGSYNQLPGGSYAHGFVKNYIDYLGLPSKEYMALFRREFNEKEYLGILPDSFVGKEDIPLKTVRLNRAIGVVSGIIILVILYIFFQYRAAFLSPSLTLSYPGDNTKISSQTILVTGITDSNTTVTVNNLPVFVDNNGHFSKEIPVFPGNELVSVKAVNSFGKTAIVERHIFVTVQQ